MAGTEDGVGNLSNPLDEYGRPYYCNIEIEVLADWKMEEVEKRLSDKERIDRVRKLCSISDDYVLDYKLTIEVRDKLWIFRTPLKKKHDFSTPTFLQELLLDVFDNKFVKLTNKHFVGWFSEAILESASHKQPKPKTWWPFG